MHFVSDLQCAVMMYSMYMYMVGRIYVTCIPAFMGGRSIVVVGVACLSFWCHAEGWGFSPLPLVLISTEVKRRGTRLTL